MGALIDRLNELLGPALTGTIGHALVGVLILVVGLIIVKFLVGILTRGLKQIDFLQRTNSDGTITDLVPPVASLVKALLTIFVLMAVLQHFGLTDVLAPLRDMVDKFLSAIPNIVGAGVIVYAGWIIAKIVSQFVTLALGKVDAEIAERTGNDGIQISRFGGAFVFAIILLPIVVSALGTLNIPAISDPASSMIEKLMAAIPNIVGAIIIMLVAFFVAKFVVYMLSGLLEGMRIDELPAKIGAKSLFSDSVTPTRVVGGAIMFFALLGAATAAVNVLGISVISEIFAGVLQFGGGLLIGALILIVGNFLGSLAYRNLKTASSTVVANVARVAILGLVLAMGLKAMGLADQIVNMAFGFTLGSVAVAAALAFGLGGRDAAKTVADSWAAKITKKT